MPVLFMLPCSGADVTATDAESCTPLMLSIVEGHVNAFTVLVERGSAIDEADEDGKTAAHLAAEENCVTILKVLFHVAIDICIFGTEAKYI